VKKISEKLIEVSYNPGEAIILSGKIDDCALYIISLGEVLIYEELNSENIRE